MKNLCSLVGIALLLLAAGTVDYNVEHELTDAAYIPFMMVGGFLLIALSAFRRGD